MDAIVFPEYTFDIPSDHHHIHYSLRSLMKYRGEDFFTIYLFTMNDHSRDITQRYFINGVQNSQRISIEQSTTPRNHNSDQIKNSFKAPGRKHKLITLHI